MLDATRMMLNMTFEAAKDELDTDETDTIDWMGKCVPHINAANHPVAATSTAMLLGAYMIEDDDELPFTDWLVALRAHP